MSKIQKEEPKRAGVDLSKGVWLSLQRENQRFGELNLRPACGGKGGFRREDEVRKEKKVKAENKVVPGRREVRV